VTAPAAAGNRMLVDGELIDGELIDGDGPASTVLNPANAAVLAEVRTALEANAEELAAIESANLGKPISLARDHALIATRPQNGAR
jgi:acyl-CoA reductase-like NAD-dependent aldehyde dehydrogenase